MLRVGFDCRSTTHGLACAVMSFGLYVSAIAPLYAQTASQPAPGNMPANMAAPNANQTQAQQQQPQAQTALPATRPFGFTHDEFVNVSETYEQHPLGLTTLSADAFTTLALGLGLHDHTPRLTGDLQYTLVGDAFVHHGAYDQFYNYLTALAAADVIPQYFVLRASAFASPILLNGLGPVAAPGLPVAGGVNTGMANSYGYNISPDLTLRFGNFAQSQSVLSNAAVFLLRPSGPIVPQIGTGSFTIGGQTVAVSANTPAIPSELVNYTASEVLSSGSDFYRLSWQLNGTATRTTETGIDYQQESGTADLQYAITREFALIATGGYESFASNQALNSNFSGAILYGGFRIISIPRLDASFRAGEQFHRPSYLANISYQVSPFTGFTASLTDSIMTPLASVLGTLGQLGVNAQGNFYNTNYAIGQNTPPQTVSNVSSFTPSPVNGVAITNVLSRNRAATGSLVHIDERTQYRLTGFWTNFEPIVATAGALRESSTGGEMDVLRNVTPEITAELSAIYMAQQFLAGRYNSVSGTGTLTYSLTPEMRMYVHGSYIRWLSNASIAAALEASPPKSDAAITVGIQRQF